MLTALLRHDAIFAILVGYTAVCVLHAINNMIDLPVGGKPSRSRQLKAYTCRAYDHKENSNRMTPHRSRNPGTPTGRPAAVGFSFALVGPLTRLTSATPTNVYATMRVSIGYCPTWLRTAAAR